mmetsp:Transcript_3625/g.9127  ORF Transcript_3625/g.9127 Transcript_3625/m.9127 type:complete len:219 (-) Transcript_3625:1910-2566(-)
MPSVGGGMLLGCASVARLLGGTVPMYLRSISSASSGLKSPEMDTSTLSVVSCAEMARWTSSRVRAATFSGGIERYLGSLLHILSSRCSAAAASRLLLTCSCVWKKACLARARASSSHTNPCRSACTICSTPSKPLTSSSSSSVTLLVGKTNSRKRNSSLHAISATTRWSTQKSSTCSREKPNIAPPSCIVRAPTAMAPCANSSSEERPQGTVTRRCAR